MEWDNWPEKCEVCGKYHRDTCSDEFIRATAKELNDRAKKIIKETEREMINEAYGVQESPRPTRIYIIGALRNPEVPIVAQRLRAKGFEVFDNWFSAGPDADDFLRDYIRAKGLNYQQAMDDWAIKHIFDFDKFHIDRSDIVVLLMNAGKSGHLELGYAVGSGKKTFIAFPEEPERFEVMHRFTYLNGGKVVMSIDDLEKELVNG